MTSRVPGGPNEAQPIIPAEYMALLADLQRQIWDIDARLKEVERVEVKSWSSTITGLSSSVSTLQGQVTGLLAADASLDSRLDVLEAWKPTIQGAVDGHSSTLASHAGSILGLESRMTTVEGNISNHESRLTTAEGSINNLSSTLSGHTHSYGAIADKPSTFAPSAHTHPWSELTSVPSTFPPDNHGNEKHSGSGFVGVATYNSHFHGYTDKHDPYTDYGTYPDHYHTPTTDNKNTAGPNPSA